MNPRIVVEENFAYFSVRAVTFCGERHLHACSMHVCTIGDHRSSTEICN
jgi:hypothetical protein